MKKGRRVPRWLWNHVVFGFTLTVVMALGLLGALILGWNDPSPARSPDWASPALPQRLETASEETVVRLLDRDASDFTFEILARPLRSPDSGFYGYGLVYRAQDPAHYYVLAIGGDGYYAVLRVDGDDEMPLVDWQQFPHIQRGRQTNRLRVTCEGSLCQLAINGEYATTVEDDAWLNGEVGLWIRSFGEDVEVTFQDAHLWTPTG